MEEHSIEFKDKITELMNTIKNLYLSDSTPWVIGYSGGKDSTATLQIVWMALSELKKEQLKKQVYIINMDTLVENPIISKKISSSLELMKKVANKQRMPFEIIRLTPDFNNTFWVNLLGRGYPFPRKKMRWCTTRLKIKPINSFVQEKIAEHGEVIVVIGTRKAESVRRAKTMAYYEKQRVRELLSPSPTMKNALVFSPLEDWSNEDVWHFLKDFSNPWEKSNNDLIEMYKTATETDNENSEIEIENYGRSRFGCWVCTMVEKDKSMEAMVANDKGKKWLSALLEFRNKFGDEEHDRERRSFRKMSGSLNASYNRLHHGPYKKEIREEWLRELLKIQKEIHNNAPDEFKDLELITIEELRNIRRIWVNEKHEFVDSLPEIYRDVMGENFPDPEWIAPESFKKEEWEILKDVVKELYPDEELAFEMAYSLIDIENHSNTLNQRKGVIDSLKDCIKTTFYKNEDDATQYYMKKENRKKEYGAQYNEKALALSYESENEDINKELEE